MNITLGDLVDTATIIQPKEGWKADTLYLVHCAFSKSNPVHEAFLHVGFLNDDKQPGNYSEIWCNNYEQAYDFSCAHYIRVIKKLYTEKKLYAKDDTMTTPFETAISKFSLEEAKAFLLFFIEHCPIRSNYLLNEFKQKQTKTKANVCAKKQHKHAKINKLS